MLGLKPIKMLPARERVAAALRKAIISRQITEGEVLTLENTAQELGVSITPVREAFQILERDGLIDLKQNKGATVLGINETTLREHFQIRAALESEACALCCRNHIDMSRIEQVLTVQTAYQNTVFGHRDNAGLLTDNDNDGIGVLTHAKTGAVAGTHILAHLEVVGQRQHAAGRNDHTVPNHNSTVMQGRTLIEDRSQHFGDHIGVHRRAGANDLVQIVVALKHHKGARAGI